MTEKEKEVEEKFVTLFYDEKSFTKVTHKWGEGNAENELTFLLQYPNASSVLRISVHENYLRLEEDGWSEEFSEPHDLSKARDAADRRY